MNEPLSTAGQLQLMLIPLDILSWLVAKPGV